MVERDFHCLPEVVVQATLLFCGYLALSFLFFCSFCLNSAGEVWGNQGRRGVFTLDVPHLTLGSSHIWGAAEDAQDPGSCGAALPSLQHVELLSGDLILANFLR